MLFRKFTFKFETDDKLKNGLLVIPQIFIAGMFKNKAAINFNVILGTWNKSIELKAFPIN